ncbi:MAG TPA: hypothetical protein VGR26_08160 [Acidimicrobiales bacterium]|nr:hypothetical protein [Acidimicrobiales bacterium]
MLNDAPIVLENVEKLDPGEEAVARIHPVAPEYWEHVRPGTRIYAHEGRRPVGEAVVTARLTGLKPP